jgi:hypothetical protein
MNPEEYVPDAWHENPEQGTAQPVEMKTSIRDDVTYHPDEEKVEIDDGIFRPADEWVRTECPYAAGRYVSDLLEERLPDLESVTVWRNRRLFEDEDVIVVNRVVLFDRDGTVVNSPNTTFETLQEATPQRIVATVTLDKFEHTCQFLIYVRDTAERYD